MSPIESEPMFWEMPDLRVFGVFAEKAHEGQRRKYTGEPYIHHPIRVAKRLYGFGTNLTDQVDNLPIYGAAVLHDVVEDCGVEYSELDALFGREVTQLVFWLTNEPNPLFNRKDRKRIEKGRLLVAPDAAKLIKIADIEDNMGSIAEYDPKFARVWLEEKIDLLCGMGLDTIYTRHEKWGKCVLDKLESLLDDVWLGK